MGMGSYKAHGMQGTLVAPDWPPLTLAEADGLLRRFPQAAGAERLLSVSPRPFSAGSLVATAGEAGGLGRVFVKRHSKLIRDREELLEEHRLIAHLAEHCDRVQPVLADNDGETAIEFGDWTYEVHPAAQGTDVYQERQSWTPFLSAGHAHAAGRAMAAMHRAAGDYDEPARKTRQLVTSWTIFGPQAGPDAVERMERYLEARPLLRRYAELRNWRSAFADLLLPLYAELGPWLDYLEPIWTHNDFHPSNLTWSNSEDGAEVTGIIDFGLADRTTAMHDVATAIERSMIEWLRMDDGGAELVHYDHLFALLAGYEELSPVSYEQARGMVALLPLVHCEFALSETDYFLSVLHSEEKAYLAYEGYFLAHTAWFNSRQGQGLLDHLRQWAERHARAAGGGQ
jgi:Ser/Thr protein kinase RdoA (MazF antagonist)